MRYRPSHTVRIQQINRTQRYERILRSTGLVLVVSILTIGGAWAFIADESSDLFAWLVNRPVPMGQPIDEQSASFKKDVYGFRELELALSRALINVQVSPGQVRETQSRRRQSDGKWRTIHRTIRVSDAYSLIQCNLEIMRAVSQVGGKVTRAVERKRSRELLLDITYDNNFAYQLTIVKDPKIVRKTGRLAIVINLAGKNKRPLFDQLIKIKRPITFGLLPWESGTSKLATEAVQKNQEVIAHLPMEPKSYPRISPGRKAILVNQSPQANREIVKEALTILSMARGVSNFMGDKIRETPEVMNLVLEEVKNHNRYYLDGFGKSHPSGDQVLESNGIRVLTSWGALDEDLNQERIATKLDEASYTALAKGSVIVTADARANLLAVLSHKIEQLELRGIEFVHVSDILSDRE